MLLLLFQDWNDLGPLMQYGPTVVLLGLILVFVLKALPSWKEVKLREIELRSSEVAVRGEEAKALTAVSNVLHEVAVEQRRAADTVKIMQRINSRSADELTEEVSALNERLMTLDQRMQELEILDRHDTHTPTKAQPATN
jgi:hypothetical protein